MLVYQMVILGRNPFQFSKREGLPCFFHVSLGKPHPPENEGSCPREKLKRDHFKRETSWNPTINFQGRYVRF